MKWVDFKGCKDGSVVLVVDCDLYSICVSPVLPTNIQPGEILFRINPQRPYLGPCDCHSFPLGESLVPRQVCIAGIPANSPTLSAVILTYGQRVGRYDVCPKCHSGMSFAVDFLSEIISTVEQ